MNQYLIEYSLETNTIGNEPHWGKSFRIVHADTPDAAAQKLYQWYKLKDTNVIDYYVTIKSIKESIF